MIKTKKNYVRHPVVKRIGKTGRKNSSPAAGLKGSKGKKGSDQKSVGSSEKVIFGGVSRDDKGKTKGDGGGKRRMGPVNFVTVLTGAPGEIFAKKKSRRANIGGLKGQFGEGFNAPILPSWYTWDEKENSGSPLVRGGPGRFD